MKKTVEPLKPTLFTAVLRKSLYFIEGLSFGLPEHTGARLRCEVDSIRRSLKEFEIDCGLTSGTIIENFIVEVGQ